MKLDVPYNHTLTPLEELLRGAQRPGDFFVQGASEVPMPRIEVDDVGVLSFPVPESQVRDLVWEAERAPCGRGEETILDTSVRNVWQVEADRVRIEGKSWERSFGRILSTVAEGLGVADIEFSAELYKLLVYERGGFFKAHRDTEKADGMFGTLVAVLPCEHGGGELVVRHAGRESVLELSGGDVSEITFAAFYADCEHEVRPITSGNRVCLVYNLVQRPARRRQAALNPPLYDSEVASAAEILAAAFAGGDAPTKLAWLLEHQYSPSGLSFAGLKGPDAARVQVLRQAAEKARCAVHLGIVHIEEEGSAEIDYGLYDGHGYRGEWEDVGSDEYEAVDIYDSREYLDHWIDTDDGAVEFGEIPLREGEIMPAGTLDDEEPDEQRVTEATGNEGASYERSYHRAALVIWAVDRFADVLLQAGVGAVLPHLEDRVRESRRPGESEDEREHVIALAGRITDAWEPAPAYPEYGEVVRPGTAADRTRMILLLGTLGDGKSLERFIRRVVTRDYDGSENDALASNVLLLGPKKAGALLSRLVRENVTLFPAACVELLGRLVDEHGREAAPEWSSALRDVAARVVDAVPALLPTSSRGGGEWQRVRKGRPVDARAAADLLDHLAALDAAALRDAASTAMVANTRAFDPREILVPALEPLHERHGDKSLHDPAFTRLWHHAAESLLARSKLPPEPPQDWRQEVTLSCKCDDCRALQAFAADPGKRVHPFRVREDRRQHLHQTIDRHDIDMTHVTKRRGSPYTLVCTKTTRTFDRQCERHAEDIAALVRLSGLLDGKPAAFRTHLDRIRAASGRSPRPFVAP